MPYDHPGNIRDFENTVQQAVSMVRGKLIVPSDQSLDMRDTAALVKHHGLELRTLKKLERRHIEDLLRMKAATTPRPPKSWDLTE